jgi:hypothetical protein
VTGNPGVYFNSADSKIYAGASVSVLGATGVSVTTGIWYIFDLRVNASANPWLIDVQVDGAACGQASIALASTTETRMDIGMHVVGTGDVFFDDLLASATGADFPLGNGFVNHFVPTSDGTHNVAGANDFERGTTGTDIINSTTTAYQLVDEIPLDDLTPDTDDYINCIAPPNDTDYVEVKYGPAPGINTPSIGPRIVETIYGHHEFGTGNGVSAAKLNSQGTLADVYNPGSVAGQTTIRFARLGSATDPATGSGWGATNFNDLRLRFGYSSDANPDQYFDGTMIEAEFAPIIAGARRRQHVIEED